MPLIGCISPPGSPHSRRRKGEQQRTQTLTYAGAAVLSPTCKRLGGATPRSIYQGTQCFVIFRSRLHWEGATWAVLKSSPENHVAEEHFSNRQGRATTRWQWDRMIVRYVPAADGHERQLAGSQIGESPLYAQWHAATTMDSIPRNSATGRNCFPPFEQAVIPSLIYIAEEHVMEME